MRKYSLLLIAVLFCTALSAQASFGLRAGVNNTNATVDFGDAEIDTDGASNLMLGVFVDLPIASIISIQPEFNYLNRGYTINASLGNIASYEQTVAFVDLGALVKLNFNRDERIGFYIGAGPTFSYAISGTVTDFDGERDVDFDGDRINRSGLEFAGVGGLTFDIGARLFVEARYNGSLYNQSDVETVDIRQRSIGINGGVMIPLGN